MSSNNPAEFDPYSGQLSVLIVENRESAFGALAEILSADSCECRFFADWSDALLEAERAQPDVVLLNPDVTGDHLEDFLRGLQENPRTRRLPVLAISSRREAATRMRAFELGVADFITKPIEAVELLSRVKRHSRLHRYELNQEALNARLEKAVQARTRELEDANAQLNHLNERISAIDRSKTSMLSSIAHELRTPANGFFGATELILEDFEGQIDEELLEAFRISKKRLQKLMDDAYLLIGLRREKDDELLCSEGLRDLIYTTIVEAGIEAELATNFEEENVDVQVSCQLFPLALKKLLAVGDGFAVENKMTLNVAGSGSGLKINLEVPGADLPEEKLAVFFDDFIIEESDVPRGNLGLQPTVAREAVSGMGGELTVENSGSALCFELKV